MQASLRKDFPPNSFAPSLCFVTGKKEHPSSILILTVLLLGLGLENSLLQNRAFPKLDLLTFLEELPFGCL